MFDGYRAVATDDLMAVYRDLGGLARAVEAQRLAVLAVLVERDAHALDGCEDAAQWVAMTDMVPAASAKQAVKIATRLEALPATATVAAGGGLSSAQLAPLVDLADEDSDADWAQKAPSMSPAQLESLARERRRVKRETAERQHQRRQLRWWTDRHGHGVRFAGVLPDAEAAIVTERLTALAEQAGPDDTGVWEPYSSRCADALVALASADAEEAGRAEIVLQVPVGVAALQPRLGDGTVVSIETVQRFACDSTVRLLVENPDGTVAGYGRRRRTVPDKMRHHLRRRDGGCAWHACRNTRGLKAHHLKHWTLGGATEEANCLMLCPRHHALVHEGGWTITGDPALGTVRFHRPAWGPLPTAPSPAPPDLRQHFGLDAA